MRYFIEDYDKHGYLKAPAWLWVSWIFLARGWVAFVMAAATRDKGSEILGLIYPKCLSSIHYDVVRSTSHHHYVDDWATQSRASLIAKAMRVGRWVSIFTAGTQLLLELSAVMQRHGQFSWGSAVSIVGLSWILIYLFNSHRVKECFKTL